MNKREECAKK